MTIYLDERAKAILEEIRERTGKSYSAIIRALLKAYKQTGGQRGEKPIDNAVIKALREEIDRLRKELDDYIDYHDFFEAVGFISDNDLQ